MPFDRDFGSRPHRGRGGRGGADFHRNSDRNQSRSSSNSGYGRHSSNYRDRSNPRDFYNRGDRPSSYQGPAPMARQDQDTDRLNRHFRDNPVSRGESRGRGRGGGNFRGRPAHFPVSHGFKHAKQNRAELANADSDDEGRPAISAKHQDWMNLKKERTKSAAQAALDKVKERKMIWRKQREIAEAKRAEAKANGEGTDDVDGHNPYVQAGPEMNPDQEKQPAMLESINPFMPNKQANVEASKEEKELNCYGDLGMIKRLQGKGRVVPKADPKDLNVISSGPQVYEKFLIYLLTIFYLIF